MILWGMMHYKGNEPPSSFFHNKILLLFLQKDSREHNIQQAHQDFKYTLQKASWPLDTIGPECIKCTICIWKPHTPLWALLKVLLDLLETQVYAKCLSSHCYSSELKKSSDHNKKILQMTKQTPQLSCPGDIHVPPPPQAHSPPAPTTEGIWESANVNLKLWTPWQGSYLSCLAGSLP